MFCTCLSVASLSMLPSPHHVAPKTNAVTTDMQMRATVYAGKRLHAWGERCAGYGCIWGVAPNCWGRHLEMRLN